VNDEVAHRAEVHLHTAHRVAPIDERIFGGFLEHLGRAVYEGVFDPDNPLSDEHGFRNDVLDALRELRMSVVRYPGGNFVSAYRWRDGVGPVAVRPRRPDFAWRSIETNRFGTDEFMAWCDALGTRPMMAVNLGTGSPADAADLVEYCNLPAGTSIADQRVANGHAEPYGVELWCLGNEMDGPWQAGHVSAQTYAERALAASALMKGLDASIETIACGSSHKLMPSYLVWDRVVLEHCWDRIDYLSAHRYSGNGDDDTASFLAEGVVIDEIIREYRGLFDYVRAIKRSRHRVSLSFDEWNVWYRERSADGGWQEAPHLLEELYNFEDALVCAQYLNAFLRHADVVRIACVAQIVNVIAPVLTRPHGILLQSIYWPFSMLRDAVAGDALRVAVRSPELSTRAGDVPVLDVAATFDEDVGRGCVSVVHRDPDRDADVVVRVADRRVTVVGSQILHAHPKASNGWADPTAVRPQPLAATTDDDGAVRVRLPAPSHLVLRFATDAS
jgi:alpha-N-arabinofuranosidase